MTEGTTFLLHPLGSHRGFWDLVYPGGPPPGYLALDLPGHGSRPTVPGPPDIGRFSAAVAAEIQRAREATADAVLGAVGVSLGGLVVQQIAATEPGLLDWIALVDTVPVYPDGMREMWRTRAADVPYAGALAYLEPTLQTWFSDTYLQSPAGEEAAAHVRTSLETIDPAGYRGACEVLERADLTDLLGQIGMPTLVLCGHSEGAAFTGAVATFEQTLPRCQVAWLAGKHAAAVEDREEFARQVSEFAAGAAERDGSTTHDQRRSDDA